MVIFRGLLLLFALVCAGLGVRQILHEWKLAGGHQATAEVVYTHLEGQPEVRGRRGRSTNMEADTYATVRYTDRQDETHEVKVFLPGPLYDELQPGDPLDIVYATDDPLLARTVVQQEARTATQVYLNVYFVMAAASLFLFFLVGVEGIIPQ